MGGRLFRSEARGNPFAKCGPNMRHAACDTQHATRNTQHTTCNTRSTRTYLFTMTVSTMCCSMGNVSRDELSTANRDVVDPMSVDVYLPNVVNGMA